MKNINKSFKLKKDSKRRVFFSKELKKALFIALVEAKKYKTYVTLELLLYGLLAQPDSVAASLVSTTFSQFRNNNTLTYQIISDKIRQANQQKIKEKLSYQSTQVDQAAGFSQKIWQENLLTPWLTMDVRDILRNSIYSSLRTQKKVIILTTKDLLLELLNRESIRDFLTQFAVL